MPEAPRSGGGVTMDEALIRVGFGQAQYGAIFSTGLAVFGAGMQVVATFYLRQALNDDLGVSTWGVAWTDSAIFVGLALGALTGGYCAEIFGRKPTMIVSEFIAGTGGLASALAPNVELLLVARLATGFGLGGFEPASLSLLTELLPPTLRTQIALATPLVAAAVGEIVVAGMADVVYDEHVPWFTWRIYLLLCALPDLIGLLCYVIAFCYKPFDHPESPAWLMLQGRKEEATKELAALARANGAEEDFSEANELIKDDALSPRAEDHLFSGTWLGVTIIALPVLALVAISYFGMLFSLPLYLEDWLEGHKYNQHWSEMDKDLALVLVAFAEIPAAAVAVYAIGFTRKLADLKDFLVFSLAGSITFSLIFAVHGIQEIVHTHRVMVVSTFMARGFAAVAMATSMVLVAECYPTKLRSSAFSMATITEHLSAALAPQLTLWTMHFSADGSLSPDAFRYNHNPEFALFAMLSLGAVIMIMWLQPRGHFGTTEEKLPLLEPKQKTEAKQKTEKRLA